MGRHGVLVCAVIVATALLVGGCGDPDPEQADGESAMSGVTGAQVDEVVDRAVQEVIGEGPFRSRISGGIPFAVELSGIYEQANGDSLAVEVFGDDSMGAATAVIGDTAYEWTSSSQRWTETPLESFDPLLPPGAAFYLALAGIWDVTDAGDMTSDPDTAGAMPDVAAGWTETTQTTDGLRRFERELPPELLLGSVEESASAPRERHEERAVTETLAREAQMTSIVETDTNGQLARYVVRIVLDEGHGYPDCAPLNRVIGTNEMVVEFSDVGTEFSIELPKPAELVAQYPVLGTAPDYLEEALDPFDDAFANENGERDLTGCPAPEEQRSPDSDGPPTTTDESCQVEGVTIRTAVLAYQADTGQLPASLDDLTEWLIEPPSDEWTYQVSGDDFQLDGPCDLP